MILTVDIGNSNICLALQEDAKSKPLFFDRIHTDSEVSLDSYRKTFRDLLSYHGLNASVIKKSAVSGVVPEVTEIFVKMLQEETEGPVFRVTAEAKLPFKIAVDNPKEVGADILSDIAGALTMSKGPLITIDMGTATVISVVDKTPAFVGTIIRPGVRTSLKALTKGTSSLPDISLKAPEHVIENETVRSMKSGILFGTASLLDEIIDRITEETGEKYSVFATGGLAPFILPYCKKKIFYEPELLMKGILSIQDMQESE